MENKTIKIENSLLASNVLEKLNRSGDTLLGRINEFSRVIALNNAFGVETLLEAVLNNQNHIDKSLLIDLNPAIEHTKSMLNEMIKLQELFKNWEDKDD